MSERQPTVLYVISVLSLSLFILAPSAPVLCLTLFGWVWFGLVSSPGTCVCRPLLTGAAAGVHPGVGSLIRQYPSRGQVNAATLSWFLFLAFIWWWWCCRYCCCYCLWLLLLLLLVVVVMVIVVIVMVVVVVVVVFSSVACLAMPYLALEAIVSSEKEVFVSATIHTITIYIHSSRAH